MDKKYKIHNNDGSYCGTATFKNKSQSEIDDIIQEEIDIYNMDVSQPFRISKDNFKEIVMKEDSEHAPIFFDKNKKESYLCVNEKEFWKEIYDKASTVSNILIISLDDLRNTIDATKIV